MRSVLLVIILLCLTWPVFSQGELKEELKKEAKSYREEAYRLQSMGDLKGALTYYKKAIELFPDYVEAYNDLGVVYESLGDRNQALAMYKKALEIDKGYLPTYTNLALLYEEEGDIKEATYYWKKRLDYGQKGEYWHQKAKNKLLELGTYPELKRETLEEKAAILSKELVNQREQERSKKIEEAHLHFEVSLGLFNQQDYLGTIKELEKAISLELQDERLNTQIADLYVKAQRAHIKQRLRHYMEEALINIDDNDYLSATKNIEEALSVISSFSR